MQLLQAMACAQGKEMEIIQHIAKISKTHTSKSRMATIMCRLRESKWPHETGWVIPRKRGLGKYEIWQVTLLFSTGKKDGPRKASTKPSLLARFSAFCLRLWWLNRLIHISPSRFLHFTHTAIKENSQQSLGSSHTFLLMHHGGMIA